VGEATFEQLREIHPQLQVKSVRRGGLGRLGDANVPTETIRLLSRHSMKQDMLLHYLDRGATMGSDLTKTADAIKASLPNFPWMDAQQEERPYIQ
jgi:hypothetical protein